VLLSLLEVIKEDFEGGVAAAWSYVRSSLVKGKG
jgi:hypothetical protein